MKFQEGDRVRVVTADSDYTGCRGTLAHPPTAVPAGPRGEPLGYYVAIDGEKGRPRPFLTEELELLRAVPARRPGGNDAKRETAG